MRIFSIKNAAADLKGGRLSEWEKSQYLFGTFVFSLGYAAIGALFPSDFAFTNHERSIGYILSIPVFYFSIRSLFLINQKSDNNDFVCRFTVLSLPAMIQSIFICWVLYLAIILISVFTLPNQGEVVTPILNVIFAPCSYIIYYLRLKRGFYIICT